MKGNKLFASLSLVAALGGLLAYRFRRALFARRLGLPPVRNDVRVHRNLRVPVGHGLALAADHYEPQDAGSFPTILIRTPYGRRLAPAFYAQRYAERGYHVVVQDVRGRFDSDGEFVPFVNEAADGQATVSWLQQQPWFNGQLGLWGQSYLGYVQWALAVSEPHSVTSLFPSIASSRGPRTATGDALPLDLALRWMVLLEALDHAPGGRGRLNPWLAFSRMTARGQDRVLRPAYDHLPIEECDELLLGEEVDYFRQQLREQPPPSYVKSDLSNRLDQVTSPVHLLGGWYDFMLHDLLADYSRLRRAGRPPYLTIGPWQHIDNEVARSGLREGLNWFAATLKGQSDRLRPAAVRLYVMGAGEWRDFDGWPPPASEQQWYLQSQGALGPRPSSQSPPDYYRYDPADPTPAVGGARFYSGAGPVDNRELEARSDVLTYTGPLLQEPLDVVGPVRAILYVRSSLAHADFFARLCDVTPDGRSVNICDGLYRVQPGRGERQPDGSLRIEVDMWATAYRFQTGHAVRLQLSSGAHPRFARNLGTGEPPGRGTEMQAAEQTIYHDEAHPSALVLPVIG